MSQACRDQRLLDRLRAGDPAALDDLHAAYAARLVRYARRWLRGGGAVDAEDVVQDVFLRAHVALRQDARPIVLEAWLHRAVRNRCLDHLRRPTLAGEGSTAGASAGAAEDPASIVAGRLTLRGLLADLAALPDRQRTVLLGRELDGSTHEELAEALGISVGASRNLAARARENLTKANDARDAACAAIRAELVAAQDARVRAPAHALRHVAGCSDCRAFRTGLRRVRGGVRLLAPGPVLLAASGTFGIFGSAGKVAATVVVAVGITGAAAGLTQVIAGGEPSPLALVDAAALAQPVHVGGALPQDAALVTRRVSLRAGAAIRPGVRLVCPAGMRVAGLHDDGRLRASHALDPRTIIGASASALVVFTRATLPRATSGTVAVLCKTPGPGGTMTARVSLPHRGRTRICAQRAYLYEVPGGFLIGSVFRSEPVTVLRYTPKHVWARVRTDFHAVGWLRTKALCVSG